MDLQLKCWQNLQSTGLQSTGLYFENQIILKFHPPTEFARDTILFIVVRSLSSEQDFRNQISNGNADAIMI